MQGVLHSWRIDIALVQKHLGVVDPRTSAKATRWIDDDPLYIEEYSISFCSCVQLLATDPTNKA